MKTIVFSLLVVLSALLVSSCSPVQATASPTRTLASIPPTHTATPKLTASPTETATPTATPRPAYLDAVIPWEMQDKSALTAEQIAAVDAVLASPWTATLEQKAVYNQLRAEGITQQTGDRSFAEPMPVDESMRIAESNRRIGAYVEWAFANEHYVLNFPLPLSWRHDNLGDVTNLSAINNTDASHDIEGFGDQFVWWNGWTGVGVTQKSTDESILLDQKGREYMGNRQRDNIYGDPFFFVYPLRADAVGDAMVLVPKAGIPQDQAMDLILRVYRNGNPRYIFFHTQFTDRTVSAGDTSCMQIPASESRFCPAGTKIAAVTVSGWMDIRRETKVSFTADAWRDMMRRWKESGYVYPMRVRLEPFIASPLNLDTTFIDGAFVIDNIIVPPLFPEDFFSP